MDLEKIERLLDLVARSGMAEVEVEEDGFKLVVRAVAPSASAGTAPTVVAMPQPMAMPMPGYPPPAYPPPSAPAPQPPQAAPVVPAQPTAAPAAAPAETATPSAPAAPAKPGSGANEAVVQAPIVGTYYSAPAPDADPFVTVGSRVAVGQTLCIIEAMKLMNEIQAETAGTIKQILVENAEPVEYDQPLFVIEEG